jgi:hypothetical protein
MQSAYQGAKGRRDEVLARPTNIGGWRSDPAWVARFRALDPGKRFAIAWLIGVAAVLVVVSIVLRSLLSPPPGQSARTAQPSTSRDAGENIVTRTARENPSTLITGISPPAAAPRSPAGKSASGGPQSSSTSPTEERATTPWLELRQGVRAYTGDDAEGPKILTVCPSIYFYKKWFASLTAVVPECTQKPRGVPVTIASNEIFLLNKVLPDLYAVSITADDSSWFGWTNSFGLQPRIPSNTKMVVTPAAAGGAWKTFFSSKTSSVGSITLSNGTILQVLAQDPKSDGPDLYAQIIESSGDIGRKGWLHRLGLDVQGDGPLLFAPPNETKPQH